MKLKHWDYIWVALLLLFIAWCMTGCMSTQKATDYLKKKDALAGVCASEYPVKETVIYKAGDTITNEVTTPGVTITKTDTLFVNGETVYKTIGIQCPPSKATTKTIHDTVFKTLENTARVYHLSAIITDKDKQVNEVTAERDKYETRAGRWWFWILVGSALTIGIKVALKVFA